jgi:nucleotide-binding universal stress UspA family protein
MSTRYEGSPEARESGGGLNTDVAGAFIVATRGDTSSNGALRAAMLLAKDAGAEVHVLAVLEPLPVVAPDYGVFIPMPDDEAAREDALRDRVKAQVASIAGADAGWMIELRRGDPVSLITRAAREEHARLTILGIGRHNMLDRLFGNETALHVLRASDVPVLGVTESFSARPHHAAIAVDFSDNSRRAAQTALDLVGSFGTLSLVHVAPRLESADEYVARWEGEYMEGVQAAFDTFKSALAIPPATHVEVATRRGDPAKELVRYAAEAGVDLIIAGSHGHGFLERMLIGSVATGLLRGAACSVLIVPDAEAANRTSFPGFEHTRGRVRSSADASHWAALLEDFTRRNAGCRSTLEIDDPDIGAQQQEIDYPFLGASYDGHDHRVEIMLGDARPDGRHLTRSIGGVREIAVMQDDEGRDHVLRIVHGESQTLLTVAHANLSARRA